MQKARSPLLIPPPRGFAFRITVSALFIMLCVWLAVITVEGVHNGILIWPSKYQPHIRVERNSHPTLFWITAAIWFAICIWLVCSSVAEILYATRKRHQR